MRFLLQVLKESGTAFFFSGASNIPSAPLLGQLNQCFLNNDPAVLIVGIEVIPVIIVNILGAATRATASGFINGIGFAGMNFTIGIMDGIVVRIGLALLLGRILNFSVYEYWYGSAIAGYMYVLVIFPYFLSGMWKKRKRVV